MVKQPHAIVFLQLLCCCVCTSGVHTHKQVIVQNYNLLFTLGHLAQLSDGVLAIENDQMGAVCREVQHHTTCVH
jgi:hypothetical protein